jgi:hypothetical protein
MGYEGFLAGYQQYVRVQQDLARLQDGTNTSDEYARVLEDALGYRKIVLHGDFEETARLAQLSTLAQTDLYILDYLEQLVPGQSIRAFQGLFSESGRITVHLGAENAGLVADAYTGLAPLGMESFEIYLGSEISVGATTHEHTHELDRAILRGGGVPLIPLGTPLSQYLYDNMGSAIGVPLGPQYIYEVGPFSDASQPAYSSAQVITGYVGQYSAVGSPAELLADIGMTAILDGSGELVQVRDSAGSFQDYEVAWASTNNASAVRDYFESLLKGVIHASVNR